MISLIFLPHICVFLVLSRGGAISCGKDDFGAGQTLYVLLDAHEPAPEQHEHNRQQPTSPMVVSIASHGHICS